MSNKLPMPAVNLAPLKINVPVRTKIALEKANRAANAKLNEPLSLSAFCTAILTESVKDVEWTMDDEKRAHEIILDNINHREELKKARGLK